MSRRTNRAPASRRAPVAATARSPRPSRPVRVGGGAGLALLVLPAVLATWVHRGALGAFFSPDDLILFERVRGLAPFPATLWRFLSGRLYYQLLFPLFGTQPLGWHVVGLALHAATTLLVGLWARRAGASAPAAFFAALLFGAAARARTVTWQMTGAGDTLAALLMFTTLLLLARNARVGRWGALATHAAALLCKENVALAPLAHVAGAPGRTEWPVRLRAAAPPLALSCLLWLYVLLSRSSLGSLGGEAYAFGGGRHVLDHLLTYTIWSADLTHMTGVLPTPLPAPWAAFAAALLVALALFAWRSGRPAARAGLVLWISLVLPVLPLVHAVYDHYVYAARAGMALVLGEALVAVATLGLPATGAAVRSGAVRAWVLVGTAGLVFVVTAVLSLAVIGGEQLSQIALPRDSFLRKMAVARNASGDLAAALGPDPERLVVYAPEGDTQMFSAITGRELTAATAPQRRYQLLPAVLDEGRGLRALVPQLTSVRFSEHVAPGDTGAVLASNTAEGHLKVFGKGPGAHIALARFWAGQRATGPARGHLAEASALYPASPALALEFAASAPPESLAAGLRAVIARFPDSPEAARARTMLPH